MAVTATKGKTRQLQAGLINRHADTQSRVRLDRDFIDELVEALKRGIKLPPVDVFHDGEDYWLGDGWHRLHAWIEHFGETRSIPVNLHAGGERDALLFAAGANQHHGLRRTQADKRRSVEILLDDQEWRKFSARKIADHCGVSHTFVSQIIAHREERKRGNVATGEEAAAEAGDRSPSGNVASDQGPEDEEEGGNVATLEVQVAKQTLESGIDIEGLAVPYRRACAAFSEIVRTFEDISTDPEIGGHFSMKFPRLKALCDEARGLVRQAEPIEACAECEGEGCQHCSRTGFVTRFQVEKRKG